MYKILIADDELLAQIGLRSIVDYGELGLELIDVAKNGREAYGILAREKPEIVVLDIKMPILGGLAVIEKFMEEKPYFPEPVFILLTNCDDFDNARTAIRLNVFDYLVKVELNAETFGEVLTNAVELLDSQDRRPRAANGSDAIQAMLTDKFYQKLLNGWFMCEEEIAEAASELGVDFDYPRYSILYFDVLDKEETLPRQARLEMETAHLNDLIQKTCKNYYPCYVTPWNLYSFTAILGLPGEEEEQTRALEECARDVIDITERLMGVKLAAGLGSVTDAMNVSLSLNEAMSASAGCAGEERVAIAHEGQERAATTEVMSFASYHGKRLVDAIGSYQVPDIQAVFYEIKKWFSDSGVNAKEAAAMCSGILHNIGVSNHKVSRILPDFFFKDNNPYYDLMFLRSMSQVFLWLDDLERILCKKVLEDFERKRSWMVVNIKRYIEEHYQEPLSLADVAQAFDVSAGYISTMFKKYNDIGFAECVTQAKIIRARFLLEQGSHKIYEVSEAVGYTDPYYFSKVFKRITGLSPKDYAISFQRGAKAE